MRSDRQIHSGAHTMCPRFPPTLTDRPIGAMCTKSYLNLKERKMSNLAEKTAYRALSVMAKMVREFEKLHYLDMTKTDRKSVV